MDRCGAAHRRLLRVGLVGHVDGSDRRRPAQRRRGRRRAVAADDLRPQRCHGDLPGQRLPGRARGARLRRRAGAGRRRARHATAAPGHLARCPRHLDRHGLDVARRPGPAPRSCGPRLGAAHRARARGCDVARRLAGLVPPLPRLQSGALLAGLAVFVAARMQRSGRSRPILWVVAGALAGLAIYAQPMHVVGAVCLGVLALSSADRIRAVACSALGTAVGVAPWIWWNVVQRHGRARRPCPTRAAPRLGLPGPPRQHRPDHHGRALGRRPDPVRRAGGSLAGTNPIEASAIAVTSRARTRQP